jgi:branched-chain amino acid transport system ATP-binding protein
MSQPLLVADKVSAGYGQIDVLHDVSFEVAEGSIVTLLGANGAGKTTTLNMISGLIGVRAGELSLAGESLAGQKPNHIVARGVSHVPEGRRIFPELTVVENLRIGAYSLADKSKVNGLIDEMFSIFPRLAERRRNKGGQLSGGEQQMLAFARALMSDPKLILLDEPSLGLAPQMIAEISRQIRHFRERGLTVLLVEQNANMALSVADYGYVLELGHVVAEGSGEALRADGSIQRHYLGVGTADTGKAQ